jgi:hypothetical protein
VRLVAEVVAALVGVVVGGLVGYFAERGHRRADRRVDAYIDALATLQTARDAYGRSAGVVGHNREVTVGRDYDLNRVSVRLEHDGKPAAIKAYQRALAASSLVHEALLRPVVEPGDSAARAQYAALRAFEDALLGFANITVPKRKSEKVPSVEGPVINP